MFECSKWWHPFSTSKTPTSSPSEEMDSAHLYYWTRYEETTFNIFPLTRIWCRPRTLLASKRGCLATLTVQKWWHSFSTSKTSRSSPYEEMDSVHLHYWTRYEETTFNIFPLTKIRCREHEWWSAKFLKQARAQMSGNGEERSISRSNLNYLWWVSNALSFISICAGFCQHFGNIYSIVKFKASSEKSKLHPTTCFKAPSNNSKLQHSNLHPTNSKLAKCVNGFMSIGPITGQWQRPCSQQRLTCGDD